MKIKNILESREKWFTKQRWQRPRHETCACQWIKLSKIEQWRNHFKWLIIYVSDFVDFFRSVFQKWKPLVEQYFGIQYFPMFPKSGCTCGVHPCTGVVAWVMACAWRAIYIRFVPHQRSWEDYRNVLLHLVGRLDGCPSLTLWFLRISRQTAHGIDLKFGQYIYILALLRTD